MPYPRKTTPDQDAEMCYLWDVFGMSVTKLGKRFNIHRAAAHRIVTRRFHRSMKNFILSTNGAIRAAIKFIDALPLKTAHGQHYEVVIRLHQKKANYEQQKRHFARMGWLAENLWVDGKLFSKDTWHEHWKRQILGYSELPNGEKIGLPSPNTAKEYAAFDNAIDQHLAEEYGVWVPEPGEAEYEQYARRSA